MKVERLFKKLSEMQINVEFEGISHYTQEMHDIVMAIGDIYSNDEMILLPSLSGALKPAFGINELYNRVNGYKSGSNATPQELEGMFNIVEKLSHTMMELKAEKMKISGQIIHAGFLKLRNKEGELLPGHTYIFLHILPTLYEVEQGINPIEEEIKRHENYIFEG